MLPTKPTTRYGWLWRKSGSSSNELRSVRRSQIALLEKADYLNASDKLQILLVLTHYIFTGEIPVQPNKQAKVQLLQQLKIPYFINSYHHSSKGLIKWFQLSANERINRFVKKHSQTMSPLEAGLLYNYPVTAILAFANLIPKPRKIRTQTIADHFFGIVHSKKWLKREKEHYQQVFHQIEKISPRTANELKHKYRELSRKKR